MRDDQFPWNRQALGAAGSIETIGATGAAGSRSDIAQI
jgi:hypothetical protein